MVALAVAVLERTVEHPRDDLHVLVRVEPEAGAARDDVVVVDQEQPVMRVLRVVVVREAEAVPGIEPVQLGVEPVVGRGGHRSWSSALLQTVLAVSGRKPGLDVGDPRGVGTPYGDRTEVAWFAHAGATREAAASRHACRFPLPNRA